MSADAPVAAISPAGELVAPATTVTPAQLAWFLDPENGAPVRRFQNQATFFIHAREYWDDLYAAMQRCTDDTVHFVYLLGWSMKIDTPIHRSPDVTLGEALSALANAPRGQRPRAAVRAMLWKNANPLSHDPDNGPAATFINALDNGGALHDARVLFTGAHHQKVAIVNSADGLVAYLGGIDLDPSRESWNDAQVKLVGPAADDLLSLFFARWLDSEPFMEPVHQWSLIGTPKLSPPVRDGQIVAQVVRTFPNAGAHNGLHQNPVMRAPPPDYYRFAPRGEHTVYDLLANAIGRTERTIYMQDQYLFACTEMKVGKPVSTLLAEKVAARGFEALVMFIARTEAINAEDYHAWAYRKQFIEEVTKARPGKVFVCQYRIPKGVECGTVVPTYVHAKTWIFDDTFAIVGSANCNRRGYTHDSEVAVGLLDLKSDRKAWPLPQRLRMDQWKRAYNEPGLAGGKPGTLTDADVVDFVSGLKLWSAPATTANIETYNPDPGSSLAKNPTPDHNLLGVVLSPGHQWDILIDPDGS